MSAPHIQIFFSKMCWACHEAMDFFRSRGIDYEAREVSWKGDNLVDSENATELQKLCGHVETVPQIFIDGKHIGGWKNLSDLIDSGEVDRLLE